MYQLLINSYKFSDVILTLDNASWHLSEDIKLHIARLDFNAVYLPPYTPIYAPVETFFKIVKEKVRSSKEFKNIEFSKESGMEFIYYEIKNLRRSKLLAVWSHFTSIITKACFNIKSKKNYFLMQLQFK